jgi:hypothetical protein
MNMDRLTAAPPCTAAETRGACALGVLDAGTLAGVSEYTASFNMIADTAETRDGWAGSECPRTGPPVDSSGTRTNGANCGYPPI